MDKQMYKCKYKEYIGAFIWNLILAVITFGFFLIKENGLFSLSYDFDSQIIPFTKLSLDAIHSGSGVWSWNLDLGADIVKVMGYYGLGSPFFWLFSWNKGTNVLYILGWQYVLKYTIAGFSSYCYLRKYANKKETALIGSILYAFSGFQTINLMFFIFHDAVALFPFMLLAFEEMVENDKKWWFAFTVFFNAAVNYYCFIGEVIFLILYFGIRYLLLDWKRYIKILGRCILEGCLGIGMASVIFIPSILNVIQNSRVADGISLQTFWNISKREIMQYIMAFILPSEMSMGRSCIYVEDWTSRSAYLPMIGVTLEVAYLLKKNKKDWLKCWLILMTILMIVPIGNGIFALFTTNYCRWFYMPVLFMILASVKTMDEWNEYPVSFAAIVMILVTLGQYFLFHWWDRNKFPLIFNEQRYTILTITAALGIAVLIICKFMLKTERTRNRLLLYGVSIFAIATTVYTCGLYQRFDNKDSYSYQNRINMLNEIGKDINDSYRVLTSEDNISMIGEFKGINSFISTISGSIPEFWEALGLEKVIFSPEGPDGTNELLSVGYYLTQNEDNNGKLVKAYEEGSEKYYLYQMENSLNIGFCYDSYIVRSEFERLEPSVRALTMLRTLVIDDAYEQEVSKCLKKDSISICEKLTKEDIPDLVSAHKKENVYDFYTGADKFGCRIEVDSPKYVFFSVPFDKEWSAVVNGNNVDILNVNGLMAVPVETGENMIEIKYNNNLLKCVIVVSVVFWVIWIVCYIKSACYSHKK